jgi:threonine dehydrogenase-like Zn-dependent dehydrogenase
VRVADADRGARRIDADLTDDEVIFLTDAFPCGYAAIDWCRLQGGETVAVWGAGPVGLMAMKAAWMRGAGRVIAVDRQPYRLDRAARAGKAEVIDMLEAHAVELLRDSTCGVGPDVCIDAVGMEAHPGLFDRFANAVHLQAGSMTAFKQCVAAVRQGGQVSVIGEYAASYDRVPLGQIFEKNLRLYFGNPPVHQYLDDLLAAVSARQVRLDDVVSHHMPLASAPEAYRMFNDKTDNCVKVVLKAS